MLKELGGLFGWLLLLAFIGTIMNYCVKAVNKRFGKKIMAHPTGKKIMQSLMKIFVGNHKYLGVATIVFLPIHFILQVSNFGSSVTGLIAGVVLIFQVGLGIYSAAKKKPRKGIWFITHRALAVLLILGIAIHLTYPYGFNANSHEISESVDTSQLQTFTLEELSQYNGENGNKAYVAYKGYVYDITNVPQWKGGKHNGQTAGTDLTDQISKSPHGDSVFKRFEIVGTISDES